jgi:ribonuclease VapC
MVSTLFVPGPHDPLEHPRRAHLRPGAVQVDGLVSPERSDAELVTMLEGHSQPWGIRPETRTERESGRWSRRRAKPRRGGDLSAGAVAEALIVAGRRNVGEETAGLVEDLGLTVAPVSVATARRVAEAYSLWGKGIHPAGLNFGDCFSYVVARDHACPLLYVGEDFARTDLPALAIGG